MSYLLLDCASLRNYIFLWRYLKKWYGKKFHVLYAFCKFLKSYISQKSINICSLFVIVRNMLSERRNYILRHCLPLYSSYLKSSKCTRMHDRKRSIDQCPVIWQIEERTALSQQLERHRNENLSKRRDRIVRPAC